MSHIKFLGKRESHTQKRAKDLALSGSIPGKRARGALHFTLLTTLNICTKILDNYGMLPETEQTGKHHSPSRAGIAMIPKERLLESKFPNLSKNSIVSTLL